MTTEISRDEIFSISQIMGSRIDGELYGYIDRQAGEVLIGSDDNPVDILPDEDDENYEVAMDEFESRYLEIPLNGSSEAYRDMSDFIETVEDEKLKALLEVSIQGRGAFGRFKEVLRRPEYEAEKARWFTFSDVNQEERVFKWLSENQISLKA